MNWWLRLRKRRALDRDLEDEIEFHQAMRDGDRENAPPFGNATAIKETVRDMWSFGWVEVVLKDLQYAIRGMRRNSVFTTTAVLLLALAVGTNTAMFTVVKRVLLDPLPYPASDRLIRVWQLQKQQGAAFSVTMLDYVDLAARATRMQSVAAYSGRGMSLTGSGEPELFLAVTASANLFRTLGVHPALGRDFRAEENERGRDRVLILSDAFWHRKFGGDPTVVGRTVRINGEPYEVIGVMPPGFDFPGDRYAAWTPLAIKGGDPDWTNRSSHYLRVIGSVKPSETVASASAELERIAGQLEREYPDTNRNVGVRVAPLKETIVGDSRSLILLLYAAVTLLLVIACSNVASLLLAKAAARREEFAIRAALGASRLRLVGQVFVETMVLSVAGGILGFFLAHVLLNGFRVVAPDRVPRVADIHLDTGILLFSLLLTMTTGAIFGVIPAFGVSRLVQAARGVASRGMRQRTRTTLVAAQLALAVLLLSGAGLVARSFYNLSRVDLGFRDDAVTMSFVLDENSYRSAASIQSFTREFDNRLAAAPGIIAAGFSTSLPLSGQGWGNPVTVEGKAVTPSAGPTTARFQSVSPRYFEALGTPLRQGRHLSPDDNARSPLVTLVDETFVRTFLNDGGPAVGRRLKIGGVSSPDPWRTIVGVVAASRQITLEGPPEPHVYLPYAQLGDLVRMVGRGIYVAARSSTPPTATIGVLKGQLASLDRNLPVRETQVLKERVDAALAPEKFRALLMSGFAVLAVILAAVGLYGVIAFAVSQRAPEIGVRMALGADVARIRNLVIADGLRVAAAGLACGIAGALALSRFVEGMLFGVAARDIPTLIAVAVMLAIVAVVASYLPARRASRIDPMRALRTE